MATKTKARAKPKASPKPVKRTVYPGGRPRGAPPPKQAVTPGQAVRSGARAGSTAATAVTQREGRYSAKHMLTAELVVGVAIVAVRAVADYEPQADGTLKGKVNHPKGQYGPLPILAGLIVSFFLLSFLAASGGLKAKLAVIAGGIIDLGLLLNSSAEFEKVSGTFGTFGKAKVPAGAWLTTGTAAGEPISGTLPAPGSGGSGSSGGAKLPPGIPAGSTPAGKNGTCPAGTKKLSAGTSPDGPFFCTPVAG